MSLWVSFISLWVRLMSLWVAESNHPLKFLILCLKMNLSIKWYLTSWVNKSIRSFFFEMFLDSGAVVLMNLAMCTIKQLVAEGDVH